MKATHRGTCQCCGALQKLPAGVLAKHGYEVARWGFFNGICQGAGEKPFEQDYSLIEKFIVNAQARREDLLKTQTKYRNERPTEPKAMVHVYRSGGPRRGGGYIWTECDLVWLYPDVRHTVAYIDPYEQDSQGRRVEKPKPQRYDTYGERSEDILDRAWYSNRKYADDLQKSIDEIERYITWQQGRIANWKPGKLQPVEGK